MDLNYREKFSDRKSKKAKMTRHLLFRLSSAIRDYNMVEEGDHIMVCHSGGKDSFALIELISEYKKKAKEDFSFSIVCLDQKFPDFPGEELAEYFQDSSVDFKIIEQDIYGVIHEKIKDGKNVCSLCARLRRGALYDYASKNNINKIAMGHHKNDMVETLFLNMFYGGKMKSMPPKLLTSSGEIVVIRPMAYINEKDLIKYSNEMEFPVIPDDLCGASQNKQRRVIKKMLRDWEKKFPGRMETIFKSTQNIALSQLADRDTFDFKKLDNYAKLKNKCRKKGRVAEKGILTIAEKSPEEKEHKMVVCKGCFEIIADPDDLIEINGSNSHTFANPDGIVFDIRCYSYAPGCRCSEFSSREFTWFSGYTWRIAVCKKCLAHIGWGFSSSSDSFFGLISEKIIETEIE